MLNQLLFTIKERYGVEELRDLLRVVGSRAAKPMESGAASNSTERAQIAMTALESLGGAVRLEKQGDRTLVCGIGCPLAGVVANHAEVCGMVEALLSEIVGEEVIQVCSHDPSFQCRFEID